MAPRKKFKSGDVFAFKLENGNYLCGRILVDINTQCVKTNLSQYFSVFFNRSLLVNIYKTVSESPVYNKDTLLIPGCFVDTDALKEGVWEVISNDPVNPAEVEFPEAFDFKWDEIFFTRGEITIKTPAQDKYRNVHIRPSILNSIGMADTCTELLAFKNLPDDNPLSDSDLRFTGIRREVYKIIGEDETISYLDFSRKHGADVSRFFQQ